jgi:hypothetical protein
MLIVLASLGLIQRHRTIDAENSANTSTGTVQFQYWAPTKCPYQYWHCRDGIHFQYGHLPSARTSIGTLHYQHWQIFAADTDEFYRTLEKEKCR